MPARCGIGAPRNRGTRDAVPKGALEDGRLALSLLERVQTRAGTRGLIGSDTAGCGCWRICWIGGRLIAGRLSSSKVGKMSSHSGRVSFNPVTGFVVVFQSHVLGYGGTTWSAAVSLESLNDGSSIKAGRWKVPWRKDLVAGYIGPRVRSSLVSGIRARQPSRLRGQGWAHGRGGTPPAEVPHAKVVVGNLLVQD